MEEISCGEKVFVSPMYSTCTIGAPPWSVTLNGHDWISFLTVSSSNLLPIRRLKNGGQNWRWMIAHKAWRGVLDIENGVGRVHGSLILRRLANETLLGGEGHKRGRSVAALLVGD